MSILIRVGFTTHAYQCRTPNSFDGLRCASQHECAGRISLSANGTTARIAPDQVIKPLAFQVFRAETPSRRRSWPTCRALRLLPMRVDGLYVALRHEERAS